MTKFYTGVGSRKTPYEIMRLMCRQATRLSALGFIMRSGGASGADTAFELGAGRMAHIYLPWKGFNGRTRFRMSEPTIGAYRMAAELHPAWASLGGGPRAMHARNCHQVMGDDLASPSSFVVCWTPDGCIGAATRTNDTGGTATAIVLAERIGVPVLNLARSECVEMLERIISRAEWEAL